MYFLLLFYTHRIYLYLPSHHYYLTITILLLLYTILLYYYYYITILISIKGTNCARIVDDFGYVHLSAGDLLREERKSGSSTAKMIEECISGGKIVPAEVTVGLLMQAMEKSAPSYKFLIDGFPRDAGNQKLFEDIMSKECELQFVLFLDCPQEEMVQRLLKRGETSGRIDDNIDSIRKRLQTYAAQTMPIIENYRRVGLTREFNSNRDEEAVYADVRKCFEHVNPKKYKVVMVLGGPGSGKVCYYY